MAAIFNRKGFVLATSVLIMGLLLLLATYVVSFTITEFKISNSQATATKTYYLAESGIAEAIWRIKNDPTWKTNFETDPAWTITYTRDPALYSNGSYQIQIINSGLARGEIIVTGFIDNGGRIAQRVVKTSIYKALGESVVGNNGEYADGDINISGSVMHVYNGSMFSNINIIVNLISVVDVDDAVRAVNNVNQSWTSTINAPGGIYAKNKSAPVPDPIPMPAISFNDASDPDSYINKADHIYTKNQFSDLMWANPNLTLDGITYVTGDIDIKGPQKLTINGTLVSEGNIEVGKNTLFCCWGLRCGRSDITINRPATSGSPSGLLAKGKINFELCLDDFDAQGLVYATDQVSILSLPGTFDILGGIISRKLTLTSIWQGINITFDNEIISYTIGDPQYSPVVTVEHWEEEY
ncbi:MAG TPA: hypothetical protein PLK22_02320 [Candidatus Paceibacterota bacterium]|nr:hypothetical protein [Candidatus Paceibacterota bacterium]